MNKGAYNRLNLSAGNGVNVDKGAAGVSTGLIGNGDWTSLMGISVGGGGGGTEGRIIGE